MSRRSAPGKVRHSCGHTWIYPTGDGRLFSRTTQARYEASACPVCLDKAAEADWAARAEAWLMAQPVEGLSITSAPDQLHSYAGLYDAEAGS